MTHALKWIGKTVLVWIALLLWAAREDGRDQERRDRDVPRP